MVNVVRRIKNKEWIMEYGAYGTENRIQNADNGVENIGWSTENGARTIENKEWRINMKYREWSVVCIIQI